MLRRGADILFPLLVGVVFLVGEKGAETTKQQSAVDVDGVCECGCENVRLLFRESDERVSGLTSRHSRLTASIEHHPRHIHAVLIRVPHLSPIPSSTGSLPLCLF